MRLPRFRIWALMVVVALAALASTAWVLVGRSREYSRNADFWAWQENINLRFASSSDKSVEQAKMMVQSSKAHLERMEEFARLPSFLSHPDKLRELQRECVGIQERLAFEVRKLRAEEVDAEKYREDATIYHTRAEAYRRAARYPWLGDPRVKLSGG
jgi:hypothetical protein